MSVREPTPPAATLGADEKVLLARLRLIHELPDTHRNVLLRRARAAAGRA